MRDRQDDIPVLANAFLREFAKENQKPVTEISPEAMEMLCQYSWRGNVRELRSAIESAVALARGDKLLVKDFPASVRENRSAVVNGMHPTSGGAPLTMDDIEKQAIINALRQTGGHRTLAAEKLAISRRTLHRKLKSYGIEE